MNKIDAVFYLIGIACYFLTMYGFREQHDRIAKYEELQKKKDMYATRLIESKRAEAMKRAAEEKKKRIKGPDIASMTNTMQVLSDISDQEVMRQSRVIRE